MDEPGKRTLDLERLGINRRNGQLRLAAFGTIAIRAACFAMASLLKSALPSTNQLVIGNCLSAFISLCARKRPGVVFKGKASRYGSFST